MGTSAGQHECSGNYQTTLSSYAKFRIRRMHDGHLLVEKQVADGSFEISIKDHKHGMIDVSRAVYLDARQKNSMLS